MPAIIKMYHPPSSMYIYYQYQYGPDSDYIDLSQIDTQVLLKSKMLQKTVKNYRIYAIMGFVT